MSNIREQAKALMIEQYKESPRLISLLDNIMLQTDDLADLYQQIRGISDIDAASGESLDVIGRIVVMPRPFVEVDPEIVFTFDGAVGGGFNDGIFIGLNPLLNAKLDDEGYRLLLKSKIRHNVARCTIDDMLNSLTAVLGPGVTLNNGVGYVELVLPQALSAYENSLISDTLPLTAGVRLEQTLVTTLPPTTEVP